MGYRLYINSIPKREYNKIKKMSREDLWKHFNPDKEIDKTDEDWLEELYVGAYDFGETLYEFGKYVDYYDKKTCKPFFKNKETQEYYNSDHDLYVVTKEFLAAVIEEYRTIVSTYYEDMVKPFLGDSNYESSDFLNSVESSGPFDNRNYTFDFTKITESEQTALFKIMEHMRSFRSEWCRMTPFNLERGDAVTTSWKFEYGLFELVRIYKHFDWKRNVMYYHGY